MNKNSILYIIVLILIPLFVVSIIYKSLPEKEFQNNKTPIATSKITTVIQEEDSNIQIKVKKNNEVLTLDLEEYIIGVVSGEMPASFNIEALKSQAITSRTYALYQRTKSDGEYDLESTTDDQVYITKEEMKAKWESDYEKYYDKIKQAVYDTKGLVMKKNNKLFKSYYFAMSNGMTEDSISVFKEEGIDSVSSPWDNESLNNFEVSTTFTEQELKDKLSVDDISSIEIISRDKTNRVKELKVGTKTITGIEFRFALKIRSTDFTITKKDNEYVITTKGYGHGVGMSQYGANGMAKENYNYKEILNYYYQDIEICKI